MLRAVDRAVILVPLLGFLWGMNWPIVRIALYEVPPWAFRAIGPTVAGLFIAAVALGRGESLVISRSQWPRLIVAALLTLSISNMLLAYAQLSGTTTRAAILNFTMPIWAAVMARFMLGERFDRQRLLGLGLGLAGILVMIGPMLAAGHVGISVWLALVASVAWGLGTVVMKRWPVAAPSFTVAAWQLLVAGAATGLGMLVFEGLPEVRPLSTRAAIALTIHVVGPLGLAYVLWLTIVSRLPAGIASIGTLMVPAVGVAGSVVLLGERPSPGDWLGLALVLAASATVLIPRRLPEPV